MIEILNNFFKRIFTNDETIVFSILLISTIVLLNYFGSILTPFLLSIVVAYLLVGLQRKIESFGVNSFWAMLATFSIFIIVGAALLILETPGLLNDFVIFVSQIPSSYPDLLTSDQITTFFQAVSSEASALTQNIVKSSISGIQSAITLLIYILLFPILVYFFLFDRKAILDGFLKVILVERKMLVKIWEEMDVQLSNYVRGKTLEIFIVGACAAIIFSSLGLNYTALLSVLVGLSVVIPYVGAFAVTVPIVIQFGLTFDFGLLIILYLILQVLDGNLLVPIIFSDAVKLHPVIIILAVFIFGSIFGFWGVFFAIPIATFIKAVWNAWPSSRNA